MSRDLNIEDVTIPQISQLIASGLKGQIETIVTAELLKEIEPKVEEIVKEHIRKVLKNFGTYKITGSRSDLDNAVRISVYFSGEEGT
jgi:hypothetical protein